MFTLLLLAFLLDTDHYACQDTKNEPKWLAFTNKDWGEVYEPSTTEKQLDRTKINCIYVGSEKGSSYMKCEKNYSCFSHIHFLVVKNKVTITKKSQGCWPTFLRKKSGNCTSSACLIEDVERIVNNTTKSRFCCCTGSLCNAKMQFIEKHDTTTLPTTYKVLVRNDSKLIPTMVVSSITLVFIIACLIVLYCWKQKQKRNTNARLSQAFYYGQYPALEINIIASPTLDGILHGNLIHQGCHSAVRLGTFNDKTVAVKVFPPRSKLQWKNEKEVYGILGQHPNIAEFITCDQIQGNESFEGVIMMLYYKEGSLLNYLRQHTLSWKQMLRMTYDVVNGLAYLHGESENTHEGQLRHGIAHRDLNSRNILVKSDGTCVLADFGFALQLSGNPPEKYPLVGSPRYMPPEVLDDSLVLTDWMSSMKQVDCYALGLVLWELCRRCYDICQAEADVPDCMLPYEEELGTGPSLRRVKYHVCRKRLRPKFPVQWRKDDYSLSYFKLIMQECWDQDGDARLTSLCVLNRLKQLIDALSTEELERRETSLASETCIYFDEGRELNEAMQSLLVKPECLASADIA